MNYTYIITAGGIGKRMGSELPKQFLEVGGKPILLLTLEQLFRYDSAANYIITLPTEWHSYWSDVLKLHACNIEHKIVTGGKERFHSIQAALAHVDTEIVAIHDGVRPFVSIETLKRCCDLVSGTKAVLPVVQPKESIRQKNGENTIAVRRADYFLVQTPQFFPTNKLKEAYQQEYDSTFTDDASVYERIFENVTVVDGNPENIKITEPIDLQLSEIIFSTLNR